MVEAAVAQVAEPLVRAVVVRAHMAIPLARLQQIKPDLVAAVVLTLWAEYQAADEAVTVW